MPAAPAPAALPPPEPEILRLAEAIGRGLARLDHDRERRDAAARRQEERQGEGKVG